MRPPQTGAPEQLVVDIGPYDRLCVLSQMGLDAITDNPNHRNIDRLLIPHNRVINVGITHCMLSTRECVRVCVFVCARACGHHGFLMYCV